MVRNATIRLPRRRWVQRGRKLADFTVGFFLTAVTHLFLALISACYYLVRQAGKVVQRCRSNGNTQGICGAVDTCDPPTIVPSEKTEVEQDAVEALVSLGIPRRASEKRVAMIVDLHGELPIEELLRKALADDQCLPLEARR